MLPLLIGGLGGLGLKFLRDAQKREEAERAYREQLEQTQAAIRIMIKIIMWLVVTAGSGIVFIGLLKEPLLVSIVCAAVIGLIGASLTGVTGDYVSGIVIAFIPIGITSVLTFLCAKFSLSSLPVPVLALINLVSLLLVLVFIIACIQYLFISLLLTGIGTFLFFKFQSDGYSLLTLGYMAFAISIVIILNLCAKRVSKIGYTLLLLLFSTLTTILMHKVLNIHLPFPVIVLITSTFYGLLFAFIQVRKGNYW